MVNHAVNQPPSVSETALNQELPTIQIEGEEIQGHLSNHEEVLGVEDHSFNGNQLPCFG